MAVQILIPEEKQWYTAGERKTKKKFYLSQGNIKSPYNERQKTIFLKAELVLTKFIWELHHHVPLQNLLWLGWSFLVAEDFIKRKFFFF